MTAAQRFFAELAEEHGARVVTEVDLKAVNGATTRADLIIAPADGGLMAVVEVKTGKNPPATAGQIALYPLVPLGNHVWPTNARMLSLGYPPGHTCRRWRLHSCTGATQRRT